MIIFISDFDLHGSGYMNIAIASCKELVDRGHEVKALGIGYNGGEHSWPFQILPVRTSQTFAHMPALLQNLLALSNAGQIAPIEALVVALDIPMQERFLQINQQFNFPYIGIFPIESGPLCQTWANSLSLMDKALVISKYGREQMKNAGVNGIYLPIGLDTEAWRRPTNNERRKLRESMGYTEDQLVVLTVADNQERKNLSSGMDIIAETAKSIDVQWLLVTRINSVVGWKLDDMAIQKNIMDRFVKFERGLAFDKLWTLYAIADAFLLPSKAEGLCMPIIEAMATGAAVVATECTAVSEHIYPWYPDSKTDSRGFGMDVAFTHQDPWGNSMRSYVDYKSGAHRLKQIYELKKSGRLEETILERARQYAESRTWAKCGDVLHEAIEGIKKKPQIVPTPISGISPPTVPRVIPIQIDDQDMESDNVEA